MQTLINYLTRLENWTTLISLAALLDPNHAAQISGLLTTLAGVASLTTGAGEGVTAGILISALFGSAGGAAGIISSSTSGPSAAQVEAVQKYINQSLIGPLQDIENRSLDLDKMVFTLSEYDTYAPSDPIYKYGPRGGRYITGYQSIDYSQIVTARFEISFYEM